MKFPYMAIPTRQPVPNLGGQQVRHRLVVSMLLTGTATPQLRDGLLDTGAGDTAFSAGWVLSYPDKPRWPH